MTPEFMTELWELVRLASLIAALSLFSVGLAVALVGV
jgi:hypothetical protein